MVQRGRARTYSACRAKEFQEGSNSSVLGNSPTCAGLLIFLPFSSPGGGGRRQILPELKRLDYREIATKEGVAVVERREKKVFVDRALDQSPYLLAENKRGLAFPRAKRRGQLLSLLNKLQS